MKYFIAGFVVAALAWFAACGGTSSTPTSPPTPQPAATTPTSPAPPASPTPYVGLIVETISSQLVVGTSVQFKATALYYGGSQVDVTSQAVWQSSNPSVASVTAQGLLTGVTVGSATVHVTYDGKTIGRSVMVYARVDSPAGTSCNFDGPTGPQDYSWEAHQGYASGKLLVLTRADCAWTATTDVAWITLTGPGTVSAGAVGVIGSADVTYDVAEFEYSNGPARQGHITVRALASGYTRTTTVTQWPNCAGRQPPEQPLSFGADGGKSQDLYILLGPPDDCRWIVRKDADWITLAGVASTLQRGDADLYIIASPNSGTSVRVGRVYAPFVTYVVTQAAR